MSLTNLKQPTYEDGRTKQSFKDETDINKILHRAQKTGTISHMNKHEPSYKDFAKFDYFEAQLKIAQGGEIFDDLPSELRNEFHNSAGEFFKYVNDPNNKEQLAKLLPGLAQPGRQNISTSPLVKADELKAAEAAAKPMPAATTAPAAPAAPEAPKAPTAPPAS